MITYVTAAAQPAPAKRNSGANAGLAFIKVTNAMLVVMKTKEKKKERGDWGVITCLVHFALFALYIGEIMRLQFPQPLPLSSHEMLGTVTLNNNSALFIYPSSSCPSAIKAPPRYDIGYAVLYQAMCSIHFSFGSFVSKPRSLHDYSFISIKQL